MARPESQMDLMHVPTPVVVTERLRRMLAIPAGACVLDPCCGTGDALAHLAPEARRYGIELDIRRAGLASKQFVDVLPCAMQDARVSNEAFGLMLLNPPYADGVDGRLETVFLDRCTRYLVPSGILVFIVKESMYSVLADVALTVGLMRYYDVLGHWRFPERWYSGPELNFGQTVLVARRRTLPAMNREPNVFAREQLREGHLDDLPETFAERIAVPVGHKPVTFASGAVKPDELERLLATSPVPRLMRVPGLTGFGRPPLPLKQGHISLTLASGLVNGVYGSGPTLHVAKGMVERRTTKSHEEDTTSGGNVALIEKELDSFVVKVRALTRNGEIHELSATPPPPEKAEEGAEDK